MKRSTFLKSLPAIFVLLAIFSIASAQQEAVYDWQFNTIGDLEGWQGREPVSWYMPGGIYIDSAVDSTATVLTAVDLSGNGDVSVERASTEYPLTLPENCSNWSTFTVRLRHLDDNPPDGDPVSYGGGGRLWLHGLGSGYIGALPSSSSGIWTVDSQSDYWTVFTADLSGYADNTDDITYARLDPIESITGNFEIDYIQLTAIKLYDIYYIDSVNGSDTTGDGSEGNPYQSIAAAWSQLEAGDEIVLADGDYGTLEFYCDGWDSSPDDLFTDWVTIRAADGAEPVLEHVWMGTHTPLSTDYTNGLGGTFDAYLRFEGIEIEDGVHIQNGCNIELNDCLITRYGPYVGSEENIEKVAVYLRGVTNITVDGCEITDTGIGVTAQGQYVNILNCHIHEGSHDGIRPWGVWHGLIEGNVIHGFDDGVDDDEGYSWNRHCDLIHFSIRGPGYEGWGNNDVVVRGNTFYDAQGQGLIINGYLNSNTRHSDIVIENNIFTPVATTMVNLVEKADGVIFRNNTVIELATPPTYHGFTMDNTTVRFGATLTDVEIYNNIFVDCSIDPGCGVDFYDYNVLKTVSSLTRGVDDTCGYGRFNILEQYPTFTNPSYYDGEFSSSSLAVNAGTAIMAPSAPPTTDIVGTTRDSLPDLGAWEYPGLNPAVETGPTIYNDTKTCFVDDFEDGHYNDIDLWLNDVATQGMSWYRPDGFDDYRYYVVYDSSRLNRNSLHMPTGVSTGRASWLLSEQGSGWSDYTFAFDCNSAYVTEGSGVCVLVVDEENCYYIDLAASTGRLVRILNGVETVLATNSSMEMPSNGERSYLIEVDVEATGITISVDADDDGTDELTFTDTDASALSTLSSGGVGFHCDNDDVWHFHSFDNVEVQLQ